MREINLEELAEKIGWREKHADKLIISCDGRNIMVVEETSRPKIDDIRKLDSTIEAIREGVLREALSLEPNKIIKIIAVVHASKRDTMLPKILASKTKRNTIYHKVSCREGLSIIMRKYRIH